jgi:hydroxymethylpyrimidine/phosphomethylpyrimidine kinase
MVTVLSIAGYDPSGGAGILADIKTFAALGCYGVGAISSLTSQNTVAVYGAVHQSPATLRAQLQPLIEDFTIGALKTGMLPTRETIETTAAFVAEHKLPHLVVDPVIRSTSGYDLIDDAAVRELVRHLLPLAAVVTPNLAEAERLTGLKVTDLAAMEEAARGIFALCKQDGRANSPAVLVKGGHLTATATDLLFDGSEFHRLEGERIETRNTHGTGCTLSAAIAARLAQGAGLLEAVREAKGYVARAIRQAPGLGHGSGPLNHFPIPDGRNGSHAN